MDEEWRTIPEFPDYEASDQGRIRRSVTGRVRKPADVNGRALVVSFTGGTGRTLGTLILSAFVGPRPPGRECSHLNGNYLDCRLANLTWETSAENEQRKREHGTYWNSRARKGGGHPAARLTEDDVRAIRVALASGVTSIALGEDYRVHHSTIRKIKRGKIWGHVEG